VAPGPDHGPVDPLKALRLRRGGPSDRAALLVELARASGLEARPVGGLVAVSGGGWARHAWAEIRLGDWVPVDPTFGTFPAGAGYVRLMQDVPADPLYLVPLAAWLEPRRAPEKAR
jgi:transglutaminase-like putative cysteine protease